MMPTHIEEFDICAVAREVADTMQCLALEKQLTLDSDAPGNVMIKSDKTKIKQILINLVGNAIKFTTTGSVTIQVVPEPETSGFRLSVRDTGSGIPAGQIPRMFDEFQQLDGASTRQHGGTGLGLSITKKLVELLGGEIAVESAPGTGSTFSVRLSQSVPPQDALVPLAAPADEGGEAKRILLAIDDDPEVLRLLRDSMKGTGYTMVGASSGEEGLALARQIKPFAITLDIMMPHRDGWSVLQSLKGDSEVRDIPVIILSIMENKALGFSLGIADYIVKPFDRRMLLEKLKGLEDIRGKSVLVVDDDEDIRKMIATGLKNEGYRVEGAASGRAAIARIKEMRPDVLFLDLNLPDMNGFDILQEIESDAPPGGMRVFILTGNTLDPKEIARLETKAVRIIQKGSISLTAIMDGLREKLAELAVAD